MQLGMIGLGRMGANIVRRIVRDGHTAVGYERHPGPLADLESELGDKFSGTTDLADFIGRLEVPAWCG